MAIVLLQSSKDRATRNTIEIASLFIDVLAASGELLREIGDLRKQVSHLQGKVDKLQAAPPTLVSPYNLAIQMARQGAAAGEVARGCGISRGEAELIVALYRKLRI